MSDTSIEWTHPPGFRGATWNPVVGCRRVSPGCEHCYAERMAGRIARMGGKAAERYKLAVKTDDEGQPRGRWNGTYVEAREVLDLPLWTRTPTCYFVNSMSDLFGEGVTDEYIAACFGVMAACPQHRFQILTKRAERMAAWFEWAKEDPAERLSSGLARAGLGDEDHNCAVANFVNGWSRWRSMPDDGNPLDGTVRRWPLPNVWLGVSVEDQQRADERIPYLLRVPAAVRFLSVEPLLGPVDLRLPRPLMDELCIWRDSAEAIARVRARPRLSWVIVGGESGPGARPMDLAWARSIVEQCKAAGCKVFVKQLGAYPRIPEMGGSGRYVCSNKKGGDPSEWPADLRVREFPEARRG